MGNSKLVNYTYLTNNCSARTAPISKITIHHMAVVNGSLADIGAWFQNPKSNASSNYGIDSNGKVALYVDESKRAWTSNSRDNDNVAVTIEVANSSGEPNWEISPAAYKTLIELCVDICQRNNIKELVYTGDKNGNLTRHNMFAATACPGPYLTSKLPQIVVEVNAALGVERILTKGCKGEDVKAVQEDLITLGYDLGPYGADGDFGGLTDKAVREFQSAHKLTVDGAVGPQTLQAIEAAIQSLQDDFMVKVTAAVLNIRQGPGANYPKVGQIINQGVYTIAETQDNWGKLKSGAGWICLDYTKKVYS